MSINIAAVNTDNIVTAASSSSSSFSCSLQEPAQHSHPIPTIVSSVTPTICMFPFNTSINLLRGLPLFSSTKKQSSGASFLVIVILVKVSLIQELNALIKNQPYKGFSWDTCLFIRMQRILRRICICSRAHTVFDLPAILLFSTVQ